jgi:sigma-E factor negative regulatory protein RseC
MIEEQAQVVEVTESDLIIEASRQSACGQCAQKSDCGQSAIAQWAASKMVNISVAKPLNMQVSVGDTVLVGVDEKSFLKASVLLYFVPLIAMFFAGYVVSALGAVEWKVILSSFATLIVSFFVIKLISQKMASDSVYQLQVLRVVSAQSS